MSTGQSDNDDGRLPLRWGVILLSAVTAGVLVGSAGGAVAGFGAAVAVIGLLFTILGR